MVTPSTSSATAWRANVTPLVAAHLLHFGVAPKSFNILQGGGSEAAERQERFRGNLSTRSQAGPLQEGDIVVVTTAMTQREDSDRTRQQKAAEQSLVKIDRINLEAGLHLGKVVIPAVEVWGRAASASELYETSRQATFADDAVLCLIDSASCSLRFAHDEKDCAWQRLNSLVAPIGSTATYFGGSASLKSGIEYHEGDCLLMSRTKGVASDLLDVVQVQKLEETTPGVGNLILRPFLRAAVAPPGHNFRDPARLVLAARDQSFAFDDAKHVIVRKCAVTKGPVASRLGGEESFWTPSSEFQPCTKCEVQRALERKTTEEATSHSLRTLDLFAGAGGLSLGLSLAGNFKTRWAVEMDPERARTLQRTHPRTAVFTADASELLAVVCEQASGSSPGSAPAPAPVKGPLLPRRGEVDVLVAGPPCQSFSKLNAHRSANDGRNMLVAVTLSWVEALHPGHVVIENVGGIMDNETLKLGDANQGFPKLIVLTLLHLGYSVRIANVEAVSYGAPQERRRMIFLAAKEGLPCLPPPSHVTPADRLGNCSSVKLWPGDGASSRDFVTPAGVLRGCAPFPSVTVMDAIDDLPAFDWLDPHQVYPLRALSPLDREKAARATRGIPALDAVRVAGSGGEQLLVGARLQRYGTEPQTPYQALMRRGCANARRVAQHQTARHTAENVERVTNVLLRPGDNHRSWSSPLVNKPLLTPEWLLSANALRREDALGRDGSSGRSWERSNEHSYQRLDPDKPFPTSVTSASPANRQGAVIHPTQTRTLTLRESARVQGFPDWMTWDCSIEEAQKQVGNAVPVPLARMLGRAIIANVVAVEVRKKELREKFRAESAAKGKGKGNDDGGEEEEVMMESA